MNNWNRVAYPSQNGIVDLPAKKSARRVIPQSLLRQNAMNSNDGGRGWCEICNHGFSMNYIRHCVRNMKNIDVCCDCKREHNLTAE
jgi:hypothetical protein